MGIDELDEQACPVARTIAQVGDAWTLMVVRELFLGNRRFEEIRVHTGMSPQLLSRRLRELDATGIIARRRYQERPARYEFVLTEKGLDLWPVIISLRGWGERWTRRSREQTLITLTHRACGHGIEPVFTCPDCGEHLNARSTIAKMSKSMVRDRTRRRAQNLQGSSGKPQATQKRPKRQFAT
jgi:DNA-binding HxlR family transcriptional regulator